MCEVGSVSSTWPAYRSVRHTVLQCGHLNMTFVHERHSFVVSKVISL
jgi:hypothetical protein